MPRLEDVDVSGVHLVGSPANRRRFAVVKNLAGRKPEESDAMKLTKAELKKRLATQVEGEIDDEKLQAFAKALGIELTDAPAATPATPVRKTRARTEDPDDEDGDDTEAITKAIAAAVTKAVTPLTDEIAALKKARDDEAKAALQKRAGALKDLGYDVDVEKVTAPEIAALEKAHERVKAVADRVGLTKAFGTPRRTEVAGPGDTIAKAVRERLGRDPVSPEEDAKTRQAIYRQHPGLLSAITKAERRERALAAS